MGNIHDKGNKLKIGITDLPEQGFGFSPGNIFPDPYTARYVSRGL